MAVSVAAKCQMEVSGYFIFSWLRPVLERRVQDHPGRNRTLEQLLLHQIWQILLLKVWVYSNKVPCKSQGALIVQGRVDIEDVFRMLLDQHLHERLMRNQNGFVVREYQRWEDVCLWRPELLSWMVQSFLDAPFQVLTSPLNQGNEDSCIVLSSNHHFHQ